MVVIRCFDVSTFRRLVFAQRDRGDQIPGSQSARFSLLGLDQPLHSFQFFGGLRAGEVATESRVMDGPS